MKNTKSANHIEFFGLEKRVSEAFDFDNRQKIADKLGVNYQTLSNWLTGRTDFPTEVLAEIANHSKFSLNWILTGNGEKRLAKPEKPSIVNEENLLIFVRNAVSQIAQDEGFRDMMRELVQEEIAKTRKRSRYVEIDFGHGEEQNKKTG